ncbi:MAG TPA: amino acid permease [Erysipelotrichaceae bacterium]|nr:amino acid permease [Erysipelotrichaceae bacterium]
MENTTQRKFGLITTIAMIVGIVIGSGIFFKTDNILAAVNGSVFLGVLAWALGGFGIIFGGLSIAVLARCDEHVGGLITYCEMTWGKQLGYLAGWFQTILYYPALVAVISWVGAMYMSLLFDWTNPALFFGLSVGSIPEWVFPFNLTQWILTLIIFVFFFLFNLFQTKAAGKFQNISMFTKLGALVLLGFLGLFFGDPAAVNHVTDLGHIGAGFFAALVPVAYSYDGWQVAPSITHEIKNPKRNLPLALTFAPLMIMLIYISYFVAINAVLGPEQVLALGDGAVSVFAEQFLGPIGYRIVLLAIVISVLGTANGLILAYIRLPYALGVRNEIIGAKHFAKVDEKTDVPMFAGLFTFIVSLVWLFLHFAATVGVIHLNWTLFTGINVDEIAIILIYLFLVLIFMGIIKEFIHGKITSKLEGLIFPLLAIFGALTAIYGGFLNPSVAIYLIISIVAILSGLLVRPKK